MQCPYCNSIVNPRLALAHGDRLRCPRCEELFSPEAGDLLMESTPKNGWAAPEHAVVDRPRVLSNRALGLIILTVMVGMAAAGLTFALATKDEHGATTTWSDRHWSLNYGTWPSPPANYTPWPSSHPIAIFWRASTSRN